MSECPNGRLYHHERKEDLTMTSTITTDEYFGGCPECGHTDGFLNTQSSHWFIRDRWYVTRL